ncbi:3-hydroxyacyl-CoA dehydrogenase [Virgibacillus sp. NKC19-16]|uniref:3-hydroxyacyl-CoA dehydrogenase n=1 Tax=Virgibacillus salidurans TaxID=2831673 RepID=UPI001F1D41FC|nr:3-hydroxyacyl-CoA dehydrogenase [Virgibacillus sp. NKC19-16]UJL45482.1 3-hydroxyacyl-CoA dehydrogenase [Virgibacillus sp. NKC19-16]
MNIENCNAIVTGGSSGLGEATARRLISKGGKVVILDLNEGKGSELTDELGKNALFIKTDVTDESDMLRALDKVDEAFGGFKAFINCAGISSAEKTYGKKGPHQLDSFSKVIQVNLIGSFNAIRLAAERMSANTPNEDQERGIIINTASVTAFDGQIGQVAYSASKGGIVAMTLPIARELSEYGIRVMAIAPGVFETPLLASLPVKARESLEKITPFPSRLGMPSEYAQLVQSIMENPMLNGETIRLDGAARMPPK